MGKKGGEKKLRLAYLRSRDNLSREEVSRRLDVSCMTIRNWENGTTEPSASQVVALTKIFDVSADYLLGIDKEEEA